MLISLYLKHTNMQIIKRFIIFQQHVIIFSNDSDDIIDKPIQFCIIHNILLFTVYQIKKEIKLFKPSTFRKLVYIKGLILPNSNLANNLLNLSF